MCSSSAPGVCSSVSSSSSTCACAPSCAEFGSVPSGSDSSGSAVPAPARRDSAAGAASGAAEAAVTLRRRRAGTDGAIGESDDSEPPSPSDSSEPDVVTEPTVLIGLIEPGCSAAGAWAGAAEAAVTLRRRRGAGALTASAAAWSCSCDSVDSDVVRCAMGLALSGADAVVVPSTRQRGCAPEREQRKSLRVRPAGRMPCPTSTQTGLAAARLRRRKVLGQGRSEGATPGTGTEYPKPDRSIPHIRQ